MPSSEELAHAFTVVLTAMKEDYDYAWAWHSNLACACRDNGVSWAVANDMARMIMQRFFEVTTDHEPGQDSGEPKRVDGTRPPGRPIWEQLHTDEL